MTKQPEAREPDKPLALSSSEVLGPVPRWWHCDTHGPGNHTAWGCPECVRELRVEIKALRHALARLIDSDPTGAIATASDDDLSAAWQDTSAECVVREQAGSVLEARAQLGRLKAPNVPMSCP